MDELGERGRIKIEKSGTDHEGIRKMGVLSGLIFVGRS